MGKTKLDVAKRISEELGRKVVFDGTLPVDKTGVVDPETGTIRLNARVGGPENLFDNASKLIEEQEAGLSLDSGVSEGYNAGEEGYGDIEKNVVSGANVIRNKPADEVNDWWKVQKGYNNSPYKPSTEVYEIQLTENRKFVRVYDGEISKMYGGWVMDEKDIKGLTPRQIQNKFALPSIPKYVCDVVIPAGTNLRKGIANEVSGWGSGGGVQYDLMGQITGKFENQRLLR